MTITIVERREDRDEREGIDEGVENSKLGRYNDRVVLLHAFPATRTGHPTLHYLSSIFH